MYVVRRPFRNFNRMMLPGSVVEPGSIKRFKTRLKDRFIVEVNAHNFEQWQAYFHGKHNVKLCELTAEVSSAEAVEEPTESLAEESTEKPTEKSAEKPVEKPAVKAAVKVVATAVAKATNKD